MDKMAVEFYVAAIPAGKKQFSLMNSLKSFPDVSSITAPSNS